jgi:hypothetical protein
MILIRIGIYIKNYLKTFPLHPLLFAIYPILFLYANNLAQVNFTEILLPCAVSLIVTIFIYIFFTFVYKNAIKASIFISIALILFFSYGYIYDGFRWIIYSITGSRAISTTIIKDRFLLPFIILLVGSGGFFLYFSKKRFAFIAKIFTIIAIVLIILNITIIAKNYLTKNNISSGLTKNQVNSTKNIDNSNIRKLDIYLITVDEFAGFNMIKNYYGYNPSWFFDSLAKKGFHIIPKSRSNYFCTENCLHSVLNMDYIHYHPELCNDCRSASIFKTMGYKFINTIPAQNFVDAIYLKMNSIFIMKLIHTSLLKSLELELHRYKILYIFNNFDKLVMEKSPKFVHIHILSPHVSFFSDSTGNRLSYNDKENWRDKKIYLGQWLFVAKRINTVIDNILEQSPSKPIIVIQSDHGVRALQHGSQNPPLIFDKNGNIHIENDTNRILNYFQACYNNVNAFYFPDGNYEDLYDTLSPVNTFRIILNHFFNGKYKLLPDESYCGPMVTKETAIKDTINFQNMTRFAKW